MFISLDKNYRIYELIEKSIQKGILYHVFFWIVFFFFLVIMDQREDRSLPIQMTQKLIRIIFYIAIVYLNLNYLFPKYLKREKLVLYLVLLVLTAALAAPVEVAIDYLIIRSENLSFPTIFTLENNAKYFLGTFFIACSSTIYKIINDWMDQQRERMDLQRQNLRSELKYLKTQINPHFFFNTLNSLYALTLKKSDKAPEIVLKLSDMMRYMLYESNEKTIELVQEINYMKNYLELEKVRHGDNFRIDFEESGDPVGHEIAPLLFIPFLENSFKHGLDHELKEGFVRISLDINSRGLKFSVENSKPEKMITVRGERKVGGIGLSNVRRRLNILYPGKYKLLIEDKGKTFFVELHLKNTRQSIPKEKVASYH